MTWQELLEILQTLDPSEDADKAILSEHVIFHLGEQFFYLDLVRSMTDGKMVFIGSLSDVDE